MEISFSDFSKALPVLYGQIVANGRAKIGSFKPTWCYLTNSSVYHYYTSKGNKGSGGFSLKRAWHLLKQDQLSTNPEHGKPENYL